MEARLKTVDPDTHALKSAAPSDSSERWRAIRETIQALGETSRPIEKSAPMRRLETAISFTVREEASAKKVTLVCYPDSAFPLSGEMILESNGNTDRFSLSHNEVELILREARTPGKPLSEVRRLIDGNEYEFINWRPTEQALPDFWNPVIWKRQCGKFYSDAIYPLTRLYLTTVYPQDGKLLEICAGDGEFAEMILEDLYGKISQYILVDLNKEACDAARKRLDSDIEEGKAVVHRADVTESDLLPLAGGRPVDLILGMGALTKQVLPDRQTALKVLNKAEEALSKGGLIILTGLADHWICGDDLRARGFRVLNTASPYHDHQFYVAKKE